MKRFLKITLLAIAGWGLPCMAAAQTVTAAQPPRVVTPAEGERRLVELSAAQGRGGVMGGVETRVTAGKPYSAEAVTESLQLLGDGNRIARKSTTRVYRDNEGRTRREQVADSGTVTSISISDPIGGASFTLDPMSKTAFQSAVLRAPSLVALGGPASGGGRGGGGGLVPRGGGAVAAPVTAEEVRRREIERTKAANVEQAETSRAAASQAKQVIELAASGGSKTTKEELGEQTIEGVRATGTRNTTVIPAGSSIGNLNEIRIVSEQWFSPELEVLVMTKHSDPRVGETIYKLTNIIRAQPDPNLFTVPADYKIQNRSIRSPQ